MQTRTEINAKLQAARRARIAAGMCRTHSQRPVVPGTKQCQPCLWDQQEANLRTFFGITVEDYARLELAQGRKCAICTLSCPSGRDLAVDHDHNTGKVRGLLCVNCNQALGKFKDDLRLLEKASIYLRGYSAVSDH